MNRLRILIMVGILLGSLVCSSFSGETNKNGTAAAQFLKIGVGARAMGLAGAFAAATNDATALYWNPAGIITIRRATLAATHTNWFADIRHDYFSFILPVNQRSSVGFQAIMLNMNDMEITNVENPHGTGEFFGASDLAIGVSYGIKLTNFFAIGLTGKFIQQSIYNESASTFAFDLGSLLEIPYYGMRLGMGFTNFGGKLKMDGRDLTREFDMNPNNTLNVGVESRLKTEPWELPVNFRVGLAFDLLAKEQGFMRSELNRLTFSLDGNHPTDTAEYVATGLEYTFREVLSLRTGYRINRDVEKLFYGLGLRIPVTGATFMFDYALASFDELDYVQMFSGSISF